MPGVTVTTAVRTGPVGGGDTVIGQAFFSGTTQRGRITEPVLVRSMAEFTEEYGDYEAGNLYTSLQTYFEEGGSRAQVFRVTGASASAGFLTLQDRDGTPADTLTITAVNPGDWSSQLSVQVTDGDAADTFKLLLYLNGTLQWTSRDLTSPADAVTVVNTSDVAHLVVASDESSATAAPSNNPAVLASTALSAGYDGDAIVEADYTGSLDNFTYDLGPGVVCIPGQASSAIYTALLNHAEANHRVAFMGFGVNDTQSTAKTAAAAHYASSKAPYGAFFYPWVKIPDPATSGLTVNVDPVAYAAAARAKAIEDSGTWQAGAGLISEAGFVVDLVSILTEAEANIMDEKRINVIRKIAGGIRVYGARSISSDEDNWRYYTMQDTVNYVVTQAEDRLEDFVFSTIDARGALFSRIEATLKGLLDPIRLAGGLYEAFDAEGNPIDPGYSVTVSDQNNPLAQLAQGKVTAEVGVRVSSIGDQIIVTVTKSNLTASVI